MDWRQIPMNHETGAALLRIWRGNMVFLVMSMAVMAVLVRV